MLSKGESVTQLIIDKGHLSLPFDHGYFKSHFVIYMNWDWEVSLFVQEK